MDNNYLAGPPRRGFAGWTLQFPYPDVPVAYGVSMIL